MYGNHQPGIIRTFRFYQEVLVALSVATKLQTRQGFLLRISGTVLNVPRLYLNVPQLASFPGPCPHRWPPACQQQLFEDEGVSATWSRWSHYHMTTDTARTRCPMSYRPPRVRGENVAFCFERPLDPRPLSPQQEEGRVGHSMDRLPWSESFLIGCQVLLSSLVSLQSFDGVDVLWQLWLPPHQDLVLLQILQTLGGIVWLSDCFKFWCIDWWISSTCEASLSTVFFSSWMSSAVGVSVSIEYTVKVVLLSEYSMYCKNTHTLS